MPDEIESPIVSNDATLLSQMQKKEPDDEDRREQASFLKTLNATQSSTYNLPPEILATIFQHTCPPTEFFDSLHSYDLGGTGGLKQSRQHFSLAAVSSLWRQVVYSTPRLWTSVVLNHDNAQLLQLHVTRSQSLLLSLEFSNPPLWLEAQSLAGSHAHVLSKVASKLKSLLLVNLKDEALDCLSTLEFPFLKKLGVIGGVHHGISRLKVTSAPILQHLSFHVLPYSKITYFELPWSSITSLHFIQIPYHICINALHQCQNLIDFHSRTDYPRWAIMETALRIPLSLPQLKVFQWTHFGGSESSNLFGQLRMPVPQSLELTYEWPIDRSWNVLFQNLPLTLQRLKLCAFLARDTSSVSYPTCLFEHTAYLRELVLHQCTKPFVDDALAALSLHNGVAGGPVYLPHLRTLIVSSRRPNVDFCNITSEMTEMIRERFADQAKLPAFSISNVVGEDVSPEPKDQGMILVIDD